MGCTLMYGRTSKYQTARLKCNKRRVGSGSVEAGNSEMAVGQGIPVGRIDKISTVPVLIGALGGRIGLLFRRRNKANWAAFKLQGAST